MNQGPARNEQDQIQKPEKDTSWRIWNGERNKKEKKTRKLREKEAKTRVLIQKCTIFEG